MDGGCRVIARDSFVSTVDILAVYNTCYWLVPVVEQSAHVPNLLRAIVEREPKPRCR